MLPPPPRSTLFPYTTLFRSRKPRSNSLINTSRNIERSLIRRLRPGSGSAQRSEEHTSELQSRFDLVCRLLLEKKKKKQDTTDSNTNRAIDQKTASIRYVDIT